jgi:hypothetical protein
MHSVRVHVSFPMKFRSHELHTTVGAENKFSSFNFTTHQVTRSMYCQELITGHTQCKSSHRSPAKTKCSEGSEQGSSDGEAERQLRREPGRAGHRHRRVPLWLRRALHAGARHRDGHLLAPGAVRRRWAWWSAGRRSRARNGSHGLRRASPMCLLGPPAMLGPALVICTAECSRRWRRTRRMGAARRRRRWAPLPAGGGCRGEGAVRGVRRVGHRWHAGALLR